MRNNQNEKNLLHQLKSEISILKEDLEHRTLLPFEEDFLNEELYHLESQYHDLNRLIRQIH